MDISPIPHQRGSDTLAKNLLIKIIILFRENVIFKGFSFFFFFLGRRLKVRLFPKKKLKEILRLPIFVHIILTVALRIGHSFKKIRLRITIVSNGLVRFKSYSILDWNKLTPTNHEQLNIYNNCNGKIVNFNTAFW